MTPTQSAVPSSRAETFPCGARFNDDDLSERFFKVPRGARATLMETIRDAVPADQWSTLQDWATSSERPYHLLGAVYWTGVALSAAVEQGHGANIGMVIAKIVEMETLVGILLPPAA